MKPMMPKNPPMLLIYDPAEPVENGGKAILQFIDLRVEIIVQALRIERIALTVAGAAGGRRCACLESPSPAGVGGGRSPDSRDAFAEFRQAPSPRRAIRGL
jgi:hypothetical protein